MELEIFHDTKTVAATYRREEGDAILIIGEMSYINKSSYLVYYSGIGTLRVGKYSSISPNCRFHLDRGTHHPTWISTYPINAMPWPENLQRDHLLKQFGSSDIFIGNNVWIGEGARLLPGVTIGDGAIIGAGAVVAKDMPPFSICVGNPCKVIKFRFSEEDRAFLMQSKWWDLPREDVRRLAPTLFSADVPALRKLMS